MDLQNVKNLAIPEGDVKMIHDKNNQLLWGAVGYDTKYAGDTTQQTYSGKNLFNSSTVQAGDIVEDNTGIRLCSLQNLYLPAGTYTFSDNAVSPIQYFLSSNSVGAPFLSAYPTYSYNSGWINAGSNTAFTLSEPGYFVVQYRKAGNVAITVDDISGYNFQLETGSTPTTYEPYVGGTASPNPDYPQDVNVVTGEQTVTVTGKNLCNGINQNYWLTSNAANAGVTAGNSGLIMSVQPNTTYTISTTASQARYRVALSDQTYSGSNFATYDGVVKDGTSQSITIISSTHPYLIVNATDLSKIQVEKGSQPTTYEPYQGASYSVRLGSLELCKIGTYQDYIYKSDDDWYVHKEINKITLDGTQSISNYNWRPTSASVGWIYPYSLTNNVPVQNSGVVGPVISDKLVATSYGSLYNNVSDMGVGVYTTNALGLVIKTNNTTLTTTSAINSFLSSNPITVYYALATPTDAQITDSDLISQFNAVHEWLARYGYNATVSGNLPIIIDRTNL